MTTSSNRFGSCEDGYSDSGDSNHNDGDGNTDESSQSTTQQHSLTPNSTLVDNSALLYQLSGHISTVWKDIARNLQIKDCIIENIDIDHEYEGEREKAYQLLLVWSRQLGSKATLHDLLKVLVSIERKDIANAISASSKGIQPQHRSLSSERAAKLEVKSHMKLQKQSLRILTDALHFYQEQLKDVEDLKHRVFEDKQEQAMKERLKELDKNSIQRKLDSLQEQIHKMQDEKCSEFDRLVRAVADKLYELDKIFEQFNDVLDELRFSYYSQVECTFIGLCHFRHTRYPSTSSSGKHKTSCKEDEELDDDVFHDSPAQGTMETGSKTSPNSRFIRNTLSRASLSKLFRHTLPRNKTSSHAHRGQEEHTRRKLSVSITDTDQQFQLQDFVTKFCCRYRQGQPGSRDYTQPRTQVLSTIDPNTLPIPRYQSTETIMSLVTSTSSYASRGFVNVVGDLV